ncbi:helix-turn-helix transcriptional regulator [Pseudonocardia sp. GCM10023141]|uniref:helix-turn-helix transcriptional regulator n=1 Tax=Pseudonocardia sp. GCM10023141 TaxID=3252653 RepID=UPI00360D362A
MLPDWAQPHVPVCAAIAALFTPHAEVALHDLGTERIVALWNPISGRAVGEDSLLAELPGSPDDTPVLGPYAKVLPDGSACTSVSAVLTDDRGRPRGLLCINVDRSPLDRIAELATALLSARTERPAALFERDWREQLTLRVQELCRDRGVERSRLDRTARRDVIAVLDAEGLFAVRHAAELAAQALGVSRATVYALLKETRS